MEGTGREKERLSKIKMQVGNEKVSVSGTVRMEYEIFLWETLQE